MRRSDLGADDLTRPGLVLGAWIQVCDDHFHCLDLLVLRRDRTHLVGDLIPFHRHILPLNVWDVDKDVLSAVRGPDESMTLRPGEIFTHAFVDWTWSGSYCRWIGAGAFGGQWAGQFSGLRWFPLPLPHAASFSQEGEGQRQRGAGGGQGLCWGGFRFWHVWDKQNEGSGHVQVGEANKSEGEGGLHLLHGNCQVGDSMKDKSKRLKRNHESAEQLSVPRRTHGFSSAW